MPLFKRRKEKEGKPENDRSAERTERKENRRTFRLEKIKEVTAKFYAVATKRKWLVFLIVAAIAAYLIIFKGGFGGGFGGIVDKVKGLF